MRIIESKEVYTVGDTVIVQVKYTFEMHPALGNKQYGLQVNYKF